MIGVIGGNGVAATNKLCTLIEEAKTASGAFRDAHHPEMLIWQATQVPSRSMYLEGKGPSFIEGYVEIAKKMKMCGVDKICICCNTAHYALEEIGQKSGVPMMDLIEAVALEVKARGPRKIALLASEGALKAGIYQKKFARYVPEVEVLYPEEAMQQLVTKGICNVKNKSRFLPKEDSENPYAIFHKIHDYFIGQGADIVVMGCTDIGVVFPEMGNTLDSLHVLARSILRES